MWTFIKNHYILIMIGICVIVLGIGYFTGTNSKVYNLMLDTLRSDQTKVVKVLEEQLSNSEKDVAALQAARAQLQKEKAALQKKADESSIKVSQLQGEIDALHKKYADYIPPTDPNALVDSIRGKGIGSIRLR